jgi:predicted DNA-binding transcriptional regulator AlpA
MTTNSNPLDRLLNEREVAELLGISISTIRRRRLLGQPPRATKIGSAVRYKPADIEAFLNECPTIGDSRRGR